MKHRLFPAVRPMPLRGATAILGAILGASGLLAEEKPTASKPAGTASLEASGEDLRNWIQLGIGGTWIDGDKASFQRRQGIQRGVYGGIEDFHYEQDVGKKGLFQVDGHGIFDPENYSIRLELSEPEIGFVRAGFSQFRSWYDGSGGYFPRSDTWISIFDEDLRLDRSEIFFEAGLTKPDVPQIVFRYDRRSREGQKDSLVWGDSNLTLPVNRGIIPSFQDIDESRNSFALDLKHTLGKTDLAAGVRYEIGDQDNARQMRRRAGEAQDRHLTHREQVDIDLLSAHAVSETRFNDRVWLTLGYGFTTLDTDVTGSRIYGAGYDPVYDPTFARRQFRDEGFLNLNAGSRLTEHVVNANLYWVPVPNLSITPALRVERQDLGSRSEFLETAVGAAPALVSASEEIAALSDRDFVDISESLDVRYTGIQNWVWYARGLWVHGDGNQTEREVLLHTGASDLLRDTDFDRFIQKYTVGANWYPARRLNFGAQYYHKSRKDGFSHLEDSTANRSGNRYPAFLVGQNFDTDDVNFRATWRPLSQLSLVSRYDYQLSTIDMVGDGLGSIQSSEHNAHIFSETVNWTPCSRFYLQAGINYVLDKTETPAAELTGAATGLVPNVANNYWNLNAMAGVILDDKTDLNAQYLYYRADNYEDNSAYSLPYGADAEEHGITVSLTRQLRKNLRLTLRYGFFRNRELTSGGRNDYDAHLLASSLQFRF